MHGISQQEYWSGLPFPFPEHLPDLQIEPTSHVLADRFFTTEPPGKPYIYMYIYTHIQPKVMKNTPVLVLDMTYTSLAVV